MKVSLTAATAVAVFAFTASAGALPNPQATPTTMLAAVTPPPEAPAEAFVEAQPAGEYNAAGENIESVEYDPLEEVDLDEYEDLEEYGDMVNYINRRDELGGRPGRMSGDDGKGRGKGQSHIHGGMGQGRPEGGAAGKFQGQASSHQDGPGGTRGGGWPGKMPGKMPGGQRGHGGPSAEDYFDDDEQYGMPPQRRSMPEGAPGRAHAGARLDNSRPAKQSYERFGDISGTHAWKSKAMGRQHGGPSAEAFFDYEEEDLYRDGDGDDGDDGDDDTHDPENWPQPHFARRDVPFSFGRTNKDPVPDNKLGDKTRTKPKQEAKYPPGKEPRPFDNGDKLWDTYADQGMNIMIGNKDVAPFNKYDATIWRWSGHKRDESESRSRGGDARRQQQPHQQKQKQQGWAGAGGKRPDAGNGAGDGMSRGKKPFGDDGPGASGAGGKRPNRQDQNGDHQQQRQWQQQELRAKQRGGPSAEDFWY